MISTVVPGERRLPLQVKDMLEVKNFGCSPDSLGHSDQSLSPAVGGKDVDYSKKNICIWSPQCECYSRCRTVAADCCRDGPARPASSPAKSCSPPPPLSGVGLVQFAL